MTASETSIAAVSAGTSAATTVLARKRSRWMWARPVGYWLLLVFLVLEILISAGDFLEYQENPEVYRQVYLDPWLQQTVGRVFGILAVVALVSHLRHWRGRRFSWAAISFLLLQAAYGIADRYLDIIKICCT
jgi:hypothetical protein